MRKSEKNCLVLSIALLCCVAGLHAQTPPIPTNVTAQNLSGDRPAVLLTWQVPAGQWHFKVYRSDGDSSDFEFEGWSNMLAFQDHEVLFGDTYYYYVTSVNEAFVESPRSEIVHVTVSSSHLTGLVSGTITDAVSHQPIPNVRVTLYRVNNMQYRSAPAFTNLFGRYQIAVDTGTYFAKAEPPWGSPYRWQWYNNAPDPSSATPLVVADSSTIVADFGLTRGNPTMMAHVHGIVQSGGFRLRGARVVFMRTMQEMSYLAATTGHTPGLGNEERTIPFLGYARGVIWADSTDEYGQYYAMVPAGASYIAVAAKPGYIPEYFNNKSDPTQADIITIRGDTSGIDFNLSLYPEAENTVRGSVRDTTGQPVPSRVILFPKPPGTNPPATTTPRFVHSDSLGNFQVGQVLAGVYIVLAVPYSDFASSFYKQGAFGVINWQEGDTIVVSGLVSNVDVGVVSIQSQGLTRVTGSVTTQNGIPVSGSRVEARAQGGLTVGSAVTDGTGSYSMEAVPAGTVTVFGDRTGYMAAQGTINISPTTYFVNSNLILGGNGPTAVDVGAGRPHTFELEQSYPNPFNPSTLIRYSVPERTHVALRVFDIMGKEIATLVDAVQEAGSRSVRFDATGLASGLYFYRLEANGFVDVKKSLLLK